MTKPVNNDSCCRFLTGPAKQVCKQPENQQPIVGNPKLKDIKGWTKFALCRNAQFGIKSPMLVAPSGTGKTKILGNVGIMLERAEAKELEAFAKTGMDRAEELARFFERGIDALVSGIASFLSGGKASNAELPTPRVKKRIFVPRPEDQDYSHDLPLQGHKFIGQEF